MPAAIQLYCLPYAGASASVYFRWKRRLPSFIEVVPLELPGRGRRMAEPLEVTVPAVLERITSELCPAPGQPFALFGHSLGAILAVELGCRLERAAALSPALIVVSGACPPARRDVRRYAALETDAQLLAELERLGGTPASVLADSELMQLTLPVLRADFRVAASSAGLPAGRVRAPLLALGGSEDDTTRGALASWCEHTESEFDLQELPGGHFFIHSSEAHVLATLAQRLDQVRRCGADRVA